MTRLPLGFFALDLVDATGFSALGFGLGAGAASGVGLGAGVGATATSMGATFSVPDSTCTSSVAAVFCFWLLDALAPLSAMVSPGSGMGT